MATQEEPKALIRYRFWIISGSIVLLSILILWLATMQNKSSRLTSDDEQTKLTSNTPLNTNLNSPQSLSASPEAQVTTSPSTKAAPADTYLGDFSNRLTLKTLKMTGKGSQGLAIDPKTGHVYVGSYGGINNSCLQGNNQGASYLNVVDPATGKEVAATQADRAPIWPAVDNQRNLVYLASSSGSIGVFELDGTKEGVFTVGGLPHMPAILGNVLVASNTYDSSQTYYSAVNLDTGKVTGNYQGPHLPHPVMVDEEAKIAYMMGVESGSVQIIDMTTGQPKEQFSLKGGVGQLAISKKYNLAITDANQAGNSVAFFDLKTREHLNSIGFNGIGLPGTVMEVDEEAGLLFVVMGDKNAIGVASLQSRKPLGYFKVGGCPYAVRLDTQRKKGFVTNSGDGSLSEFDLEAVRKAVGY